MPVETLPPGKTTHAYDLVKTTIDDLGTALPHGPLTHRPTTVEFHPPTMGVQKRQGALRTRKDLAKRTGKMIPYFLAVAIKSAPGLGLTGDLDKDALAIARLTVGDVLHLLCLWQRVSRPKGLEIGVPGGCTSCGTEIGSVHVDIGTIEVTALPTEASPENPPIARVGLHLGFPLQGKTVRTVLLKPAAWIDSFWGLTDEQWANPVLWRAASFQGSIIGNDVIDMPKIPMSALDELMPDDMDLIDEALAEISPTADLSVDVECPECKATVQTAVDWMNPDFFGGGRR